MSVFVPIYLLPLIQQPLKLYIYNWQELPVGGAPDYYPRLWTYFLAGALAFLYRDRAPVAAGQERTIYLK